MKHETEYSYHDAANLFPMLDAEELEALAYDIKRNGLHTPIVLYEGQILDGRNRYRACQQAGIEPRFVEWEPNGISPLDWVLSQNIHRRHLSASQRACLAVEIRPQFAEEAKRNQLSGLKRGKGSRSDKSSETGKPTDSRYEAARRLNVSQSYVSKAQKIKDADEVIFDRVKRGVISLSEAEEQLREEEMFKRQEAEAEESRKRWEQRRQRQQETVDTKEDDSNDTEEDDDDSFEETLRRSREKRAAREAAEAKAEEEEKQKLNALVTRAKSIIETGRKHSAKTAHPDVGGSHEEMQEVNAVTDWLLHYIEGVPKLCSLCNWRMKVNTITL